ncbi:unnamed protein product [Rotaria socialis]|nr:unnamed protein product [Rotaria socialis]
MRANAIDIHPYATWSKNGITVAGGNEAGIAIHQLYWPYGLYVDDDLTIYVVERGSHRISEWKSGATNGTVVAGGNGADRLKRPFYVIIDKESDSLIISDTDNSRVIRWPRRKGTRGETIISNIDCFGLTMDDNGFLYVVDSRKREVRRHKIGDTEGTVVAGGNGNGYRLDQLSIPRYVFVDREHSVYVTEYSNHRVAKWELGAKQGIAVAGGQGQENSLTQLDGPQGVVVDQLGTVYVTDYNNNRIMGWSKGATQGIVIAGKGYGAEPNQINWIVPVVYHSIGMVISMSSTSEILEYKNLTLNKLNLGVGVGVFRMDFLRFKATYDAFRLLLRQSSSDKLRI